jgi:ribosome-associated protein
MYTNAICATLTAVKLAACDDGRMQEIEIRGEMIRLGQLLKLSAIAGSGGEARDLLADRAVTVNGEPEVRRGRQLHPGDVVMVGERALRVV